MSGKLIFNYGTMRCGKSALLIQKAYQFNETGKKVLVLKPALDTRSDRVSSRIGISWPAISVSTSSSIVKLLENEVFDILMVDETNFLTSFHIDELAHIADTRNILVMAFGLKCDFEGVLFDSSKRLFELADRFDEMPSMCDCGRKATKHVRLTNETEQFVVGDTIYKSVCRPCFKELMLG